MNYIVLDLEWNQPLSPQRMVREPFNLGGEIIQFGAVKIDSLRDLNIIDKYSEIVRPVFYTKMNKNVTEVTDLTDEVIEQGRPFEVVCNEFLDWCGDDSAFITWSNNDIYMLEDNMVIHDMDIAYAGRSEQSARHFRAGSPLIQSTLAGVLSTVANM